MEEHKHQEDQRLSDQALEEAAGGVIGIGGTQPLWTQKEQSETNVPPPAQRPPRG